jgi:putative radical SAM enzyme (TIGR03279 family)
MQSTRHLDSPTAALITAVVEGSPAAAAGIEPGDRLLAIGGAPVRDCVDYRFLCAEERIEVEILKPDGARRVIVIEKHPDQDLGLDFLAELFDGVRRCCNRCIFCFYDQLPNGLRESLYIRDDDFRLSFLHGNFVTLSNLSQADLGRICEQRLSPLYVSVHATELALRRRMLGNSAAPDVLDQMRRLAAGGIEMHAQVVLCPGINDGAALSRTIADLAALHPAVKSVAIVPVGLTRHRARLPKLRAVDAPAAREVLRRVNGWQAGFLAHLGSRFVFAADELYLLAGEEFPQCEQYEGFPQRENGVGLARLFLDELQKTDFGAAAGLAVTLMTGLAARGLVEEMAAKMRRHNVRADVIVASNRLLGDGITIAGLLAGEDLAAAVQEQNADGIIAVPAQALRDGEFLDGMKLQKLCRRLGKQAICAAGPRELARKLAGVRRRQRKPVPAHEPKPPSTT